jgi:hypothetical protein
VRADFWIQLINITDNILRTPTPNNQTMANNYWGANAAIKNHGFKKSLDNLSELLTVPLPNSWLRMWGKNGVRIEFNSYRQQNYDFNR